MKSFLVGINIEATGVVGIEATNEDSAKRKALKAMRKKFGTFMNKSFGDYTDLRIEDEYVEED